MSAWIVDSGHIDVLVSAARQYGLLPADRPAVAAATGQMLWVENHRSVNHRYDEDTVTPVYQPSLTSEDLHPVAVLKAIGCYDYQTCEHPGWRDSAARAFTVALSALVLHHHREMAVVEPSPRYADRRLVAAFHHHPVYHAAPWGFTDVTEALTSAYHDTPQP